MKKQLLVISGQDRVGKDTYMEEREKLEEDGIYHYVKEVGERPDYRNDRDAWTAWLNKWVEEQANELKDIGEDPTVKGLYMGRLQLDDDVYCTMFGREKVNEKYMHIFEDLYDIKYVVFLWKDFDSYINRLKAIGDNFLEYNKEDFDKVKKLYEDFAKTKYKDCAKIIYLDGTEDFAKIHKKVMGK